MTPASTEKVDFSKNEIHTNKQKKQAKTESPKSNTTGRITRKKQTNKNKKHKKTKNNTNINQNMDFPQRFFVSFVFFLWFSGLFFLFALNLGFLCFII